MSPGLCFRILEHLEELGLLQPGAVILDFMAGIGTTGLAAAVKGYRSIMIELEPKFMALIQANKERLEKRIGKVDMTILQGDSRHLSQLLQERGCVAVSSPPYAESEIAISLPTSANPAKRRVKRAGGAWEGYGITPGQIGNLPDRPLVGISSPPYANRLDPKGVDSMRRSKDGETYGHTPGQIGNLPDKPLVAISSPPYEDSDTRSLSTDINKKPSLKDVSLRKGHGGGKTIYDSLETEGQIGQERGESYQGAMLQVYSEAAKICSVLALVTKNPTREGKLYPLDEITIKLLEASGWEIFCRHRAILFEEQEQGHLFEGSKKQAKGRLGFFKRLSWQKGSPVADHEDVLIAVNKNKAGYCGITSPPYSDADVCTHTEARGKAYREKGLGGHKAQIDGYGQTPGQIGNLK